MKIFRHQTALYLSAFLLALVVRVIGLGNPSLTDIEARWALQALGVAQGLHPALGSQPVYILLTALFFFLYGDGSNFLARLLPAITGSALVFVPYLFRDRLKPRPSLILAFLLALEPGLVAVSRQADSPILAVTFLLFAWGFWERKRSRWAGVFAGLALLSGTWLWSGFLALAVTWAIYQIIDGGQKTNPEDAAPVRRDRSEWLTGLWFAIGTIVLGGSLFFVSPNGLSAWLSAIPEYFQGWTQPSGVPAGLLLFSLVAYQPLGLILAIIITVRGWFQRSRRVKFLSLWMIVAFLLALFYPGHRVADLAWMLIPLWSLAALELARNLIILPEERREVLGVVTLSALILVFIWFDFLGLIQPAVPSDQVTLRTWLMVGSFFLLIVSILLVAVGWSIRVARLGAILGLTAVLGVYSFAAMLGAAGLRVMPDAVEMWAPDRSVPEADLLLLTVDQMSDWSNDNINSQPVTIVGINSSALKWLLHDHTVNVVSALDISTTPPIVITTDQVDPALAAGYRGQSFVWRQTPQWSQAQVSDLVSWISFHQIPVTPEKIIVWVRSDLFIDSPAPKP
jgi:hypothetical protein